MKLIELTDENTKFVGDKIFYIPGEGKPKPKRKPAKKKQPPKPSRLAFAADLINWCMFMVGRGVLIALFLVAMYIVFMGVKP